MEKFLLVGSYEYDGATSMRIWAGALHRELLQAGIDVQLIVPRPAFGKLKPSAHGIGKWLGYIDRFVIFPGHCARRQPRQILCISASWRRDVCADDRGKTGCRDLP